MNRKTETESVGESEREIFKIDFFENKQQQYAIWRVVPIGFEAANLHTEEAYSLLCPPYSPSVMHNHERILM